MKRIVLISVVLIYFKACLNTAGTSSLNPISDPETENVIKKVTNPTAENVIKIVTNPTAELAGKENHTRPNISIGEIVRLTNCSVPMLPENGGLVCVYVENTYFCKPMCNPGYDFAFLRRSRLYEECGKKNGFIWTTQYIGGSQLAECIASEVLVSGHKSAYFTNTTCAQVVSFDNRKQHYIDEFIGELKTRGIHKNHRKDLEFVACGK